MNKKKLFSMIKQLLTILIISCMACMPVSLYAQDTKAQVDEQNPIVISVYSSTIRVKNALQCELWLYDLTGTRIRSIKIDSPDKIIELNSLPKGYYIVKIGNFVRRISLN